ATARSASTELAELAAVFASPAIAAAATTAQGAVLLAEGDSGGAAEFLTRGVDLWRDASAPYDRARTRALLARALFEVGDTARARGEQRAALTVFESLGARLEVIRATEFNAALEASRSEERRVGKEG